LTSIGAIATVGEVLKGSITDIIVSNGGFGFRDSRDVNSATVEPTSMIDFKSGFDDNIFTGTEAAASISLVDDSTVRTITVSNTTIEFVFSQSNQIMNIESSTVGSIPNTTYQTFNVYPISFVTIDGGGGGGYKYKPDVEVYSFYRENEGDKSYKVIDDTELSPEDDNPFTKFDIKTRIKKFFKNAFSPDIEVIDELPKHHRE
jgi:hypothetical protein